MVSDLTLQSRRQYDPGTPLELSLIHILTNHAGATRKLTRSAGGNTCSSRRWDNRVSSVDLIPESTKVSRVS